MNTTFAPSRGDVSLLPITAWAMIAGGILTFILGVPLAPFQDEGSSRFTFTLGLNAISHLLLIAGVSGLTRSGASGSGALATWGIRLTLLGLTTLTIAEFVAMADTDIAGAFYGLATLAMGAGLVMAGIAVRRAGVWAGWRRHAVLACGLYIPLVLIPAFALPGYGLNFAIGIWGITWLLIGVAMRDAR